MDDLLGLDSGDATTKWQRQHAARPGAKLAKLHLAETRAAKKNALREAKPDLKKRKAKCHAFGSSNALSDADGHGI